MEADLEGIQDRLARLERQGRRQRQLGAVALIVLAVLMVMGQASTKKIVEANEFVLRDDSGNVRVRLGFNHYAFDAPEMSFFDHKGRTRLFLDGAPGIDGNHGGTVAVYDGLGKLRGHLTATVSEGAQILMFDSLSPRPYVRLAPGGLELAGADSGGQFSSARLLPGHLDVSDGNGFRSTLGKEELLTPKAGHTTDTSAASLVLFDAKQKVIWKAP